MDLHLELDHQLRGVGIAECGRDRGHQVNMGRIEMNPLLPSRPHVPLAIRHAGEKGWGVFSDLLIAVGTQVFVLNGQLIDDETLCQLIDAGKLSNDDPLHVDKGVYCILDSLSNLFNHGCDPNLGIRGEGELFALRDIQPGEELCYDYSTTVPPGWSSADWSMECHCGSPMCRRILGDVLTLPASRLEFYQLKRALTDHVLRHLTQIADSPMAGNDGHGDKNSNSR